MDTGGRAALGTAAEVVPIPLLWRGARQGGVVERRREQAAEEGGGPGCQADCADNACEDNP